MSRVAQAPGIGHDDAAARRERTEDVVHRQVEAERREGQHPIVGADGEAAVDIEDGVERASMIDHDALGQAGGARREDDVREILRLLHWLERRIRHPGQGIHVHLHPPHALRPVERGVEPGLGQRDLDLAVLEHVAKTLGGPCGVDREVGGARVQDPEGGNDLLPPLLHHHGDERVGPHAQRPEIPAQPVRVAEQLVIRDAAVPGDHRGLRRPLARLLDERGVEQQVGLRCSRVVHRPTLL